MALPKDFKQDAGLSKYTMSNLKTLNKVKIRVLSDFITGKSVWGEPDGKRINTKRRSNEPIPANAIGWDEEKNRPEPIKQFIAAVVYNYTTEQVEIFETDKSTVIGQIVNIESEDEWGDSKGFDLTINKSGERLETKYTVLPSGLGKFTKSVQWKDVKLEALYDGGDPFKTAPTTLEDSVADDAYDALK